LFGLRLFHGNSMTLKETLFCRIQIFLLAEKTRLFKTIFFDEITFSLITLNIWLVRFLLNL